LPFPGDQAYALLCHRSSEFYAPPYTAAAIFTA
jgi:hypothetical protein